MNEAPDLGQWIADPQTGEVRPAFPIKLEEIAKGTVGATRRARRADPLVLLGGITDAQLTAAAIYRQAHEHVEAGHGMGPMPWAADRPQRSRGGGLLQQERAISAAEWLRRGNEAAGKARPIVVYCVLGGGTVSQYDRKMRWRRHSTRTALLAALERMARAYNLA